MKGALAIARKELAVYFTTPVAWVTFMVVAFFAAQFFVGSLDAWRYLSLRAVETQDASVLERMNVTDMVVARVLGSTGVFILLAAPFLSMRLIAEEKRTRTFELLLTAPVRPFAIVLGKYLAALGVLTAALAIVAVFPGLLAVFARGSQGGSGIEWATVATGFLGLFLLGAMALALGLFVSSLTESVVVAALISLILLLALWVVTIFATGAEGPAKELTLALSASEHLTPFLQGRIELKDVVYYLSFVVLGLYLTDRAVEAQRWT
ncbi:MAG TPA: ABC transporter permease [Anaeromyxobacteraceae bacterium]|jgi:ABC-2 type transport system permease protein|nr:ABC transporter permease [Anaeromyxobacteraceae bacterium]